jgi:hypothetical protein
MVKTWSKKRHDSDLWWMKMLSALNPGTELASCHSIAMFWLRDPQTKWRRLKDEKISLVSTCFRQGNFQRWENFNRLLEMVIEATLW